ncbi:non-ribosomal peptide synthetase [Metarhizium album ARSEF 1941]|uniref:Non-ribosomal peptide synthetase n=1 Tax=Metarhizium album (strain ARSEF 1941) TaxID=1081103 RepID=A0A0B2WJB0_METAS|nr:non-ribosomal peptide synthetase [Metarhizium album ARSEF 1941]KHN96131.1 non-ribosomal peptide synthetase [Metarhizium album ARSEF 1941]
MFTESQQRPRTASVEDIWSQNAAVPETVEACVHALVKRTVWQFPGRQAVCSWDGDLTYKELDAVSSKLALHLVDIGLRVGNHVLLSFEKSQLAPVAVMAVMKAGGVSVAVDGSHCQLASWASCTRFSLCLASAAHAPALADAGMQDILTLDRQFLLGLSAKSTSSRLPKVTPSDGLFATLDPASAASQKAAIVTHSQFSSAAVYQKRALGFCKDTRTLDHISYASPVAWCYLLHTLCSGGCLCMPSPHRDSVPSSAPGNANCAFVTPDRAHDPSCEDVSTLVQVGCFGGEASFPDVSPRESERTVLSAYGCAKLASVIPITKTIIPYTLEDQTFSSDSGVFDGEWGSNAFKSSIKSLAAYEPSKDDISFSEPAYGLCLWIVDTNDPDSLAPIGTVGELWFEGPILGGQGGVDEEPCFVENPAWLLKGSQNHPGRTGLLLRTGALAKYRPDGTIQVLGHGQDVQAGVVRASLDDSELDERPCDSDPSDPRLGFRHDDDPQNEVQSMMQRTWGAVLHVDPAIISRDSHFFRMGGNMVHAILLCKAARSSSIWITTRDVYKNPLLKDMSEICSRHSSDTDRDRRLGVPSPLTGEGVRSQVSRLCGIEDSRVIDVLPCTALQEGLLALTVKHPGDYVARNLFSISRNVDVLKLRKAWDHVVMMNSILRTRIVSLPEIGIVQAVLAEETHWTDFEAGDNHSPPMGLGTPLTRFSILPQNAKGEVFLLWEVHHALYDGWSMGLLLQDVQDVYYGNEVQDLEPMDAFLEYMATINENTRNEYWRTQFAGIQGCHFPTVKGTDNPRPDQQLEMSVSNMDWSNSDFTSSTILRAAWCIVSAHNTNSNEALFGVTVTGRQAPVPEIERMTGPTIATVPLRATLDWDDDAESILHRIQRQSVDMIPFEQTGLQHIRRLGEEPCLACNFQTLLVVQPPSDGGGLEPEEEFLTEVQGEENGNKWQDFSTYALVIECQLEAQGVGIRFGFDSEIVSEPKMAHIAANLETVIRHLSDQRLRKQTLRSIITEHLAPFGIDQIWAWNKDVPEPTELCVHELISQRVLEDPSAPAICAWDGGLTYGQLSEMSDNLAQRLVGFGIRGCLIPLYFEKSMWMPVAAVAVMKAGAGVVAVDMKLPDDRIRSLVSQLESPVALSSVEKYDLVRRLSENAGVLTVGPGQQCLESLHPAAELPIVQPSDMLYAVFTSGSTGTPKGAMVSHRNFCSAITYQQKPLMFSRSSRVFDFSSYAFDASWCNLIHALTSGGCLCIPSAFERENQLAECFKKYNVTSVDLTPSVARMLGPKVLCDLTTLILGGEAVVPTDVLLAGDDTTIINVYGPAECTPTVTMSEICSKKVTIGRGAGACTWVVDVNNPELLAPLGETGELWVEGPLVGQGYLSNPEKTAAAFVQDPVWLTRGAPGHPGRAGRLYRTGDLVRYTNAGELIFVGRKDTQVKIRGQRVELEDIEHHIVDSMNAVKNGDIKAVTVVAETIRPKEASSAVLVAFVALESSGAELTDEKHEEAVQSLVLASNERLQERIPVYMVPTSYIPIRKIPMTPSGKANRRLLREIAESAWKQYRNLPDKTDSPEILSEVEERLQRIWMSVLNLSAEEISVTKTFTRIGGDSISAMQIVAQCRQHSISVTVADILQSGTIRKLASQCKSMSRHTVPDDDDGVDEEATEPFDLSPIQQLFFDAYPSGLNHFNQKFVLELGLYVPGARFLAAIQDLVDRHAILRNRFHRPAEGASWRQSIAPKGPSSFAFAEHNVSSRDEAMVLSQWRQENLDIEHGPVFACDFFNIAGDVQLVTLSAHHLVVDLVSWRIIWGDIEDHIQHGSLISAPSTSWKSWLRRQVRANRRASPISVLPYSVPLPDLDFWGLPLSDSTFGNCTVISEAFEPSLTDAMFGDANECLRTEPMDILLGTMAHSFHHVFPERSVPVIWLEGHGREHSEDLPVDVSGTVGWFTTLHPIPISVKPGEDDSLIETIRFAKDIRRKVPGKGQPYFACRFYSEAGREAARGQEIPEVTFNFTGRFQQLEAEEGLFKRPDHMGDSDDDLVDVSQTAHRLTMIEITADVEDGWLVVTFQVHKDMKHQQRLQQWAQEFGRCMQRAVDRLCNSAVSFTLSDLPLLPMSYSALDTLLCRQLPSLGIPAGTVEEILPCSPLQQGILLSSEKGIASYATSSTWRCLATPGLATRIEPQRLGNAWTKLAQRHSILSTVFALHPEGDDFMQIVLKNTNSEVKFVGSGSTSPEAMLDSLPKPTFKAHEPQHLFFICQSDSGEVACRLDISHALIDAASMSVMLQDLISFYDGITPAAVPPFGDVMRHICSIPHGKRVAPWVSMLTGVSPCEFPLSVHDSSANEERHCDIPVPPLELAEVTELCKNLGITRAVFFQVAWAMVLATFTGMDEVCFGYLASGRDVPIDGIEAIVGPLANLLISRIDLRDSPRQVLQSVSSRSIQHLAMQYASLAEIQHELGLSGKKLFNTSFSIRASDKLKSSENRSLSFESSGGEDPHEFDISLSASIDGDNIDLVVEYREPYIQKAVAAQACDVLFKAITYLLQANYETQLPKSNGDSISWLSPISVFDGFYKQTVGTDEATTTAFWKDQFRGITGCHFPSPPAVGRSRAYKEVALFQKGCGPLDGEIEPATCIKAAWAILVATMLDSSEAIFGMVSDDNALLPVRVPIMWDDNVNSLLHFIQKQGQDLDVFKRTGLQRIRRINAEAALACDFQSILSINHDDAQPEQLGDFAILFKYNKSQFGSHVSIIFDSNTLSEKEVTRLFYQFEHVHQQLLNPVARQSKLHHVSTLSCRDLEDVWAWNEKVPESVLDNVPRMVRETVHRQPLATAIHAWDGSLTYQQLDDLSTTLAYQLRKTGVGRGDVIPLFFDKSMWMPVSALAVMKTGAACVGTDPSNQPEERLRAMVTQVRAKTVLASAAYADIANKLGADHVVSVDVERLFEFALSLDHEVRLPEVTAFDVLYIVFTSGSTGVPKGAMVTHGNFCSAIVHQRDLLGFGSDSRVLDFSSYAFDVAWSNMLNTLTAGGCLCIPSPEERQDGIAGCLDKYQITVADFTPSVLRNIEPKAALTRLSTMLLGGEVVLPSDAQYVSPGARVVSAYGLAECTPTSIILDLTPEGDGGLGFACGSCAWIVDAENPDRLAPIGTVGELWLEGPLIGAGYVNDAEKTKAAYIQDPEWLLRGVPGKRPGRRGRVYRTVDLVQYREDGSLIFKGRKDTQVKIRGQRVELEEVEHYVQDAISTTSHGTTMTVVAETIKPVGSHGIMLVAFVCLGSQEMMSDQDYGKAVRSATCDVAERLGEQVPSFMIPSVFIPIRNIPMTATGKTDRRHLRNYGSSLDLEDIAALGRAEGERRGPTNDSERLMQGLWAEVLSMEPDNISIDDSFFRIGGDSIGAMKLVALARKTGLPIAVKDVFKHPTMRDLCKLLH